MEKAILVQLLGEGLSSREIARQVGASQTNVRYWIKKHSLKLRTWRGQHPKGRCCAVCGETDPGRFYGRKANICGRCSNQRTIDRGHATKKRAREYLGGECAVCGFSRYDVALDIHHLDPTRKDPAFPTMRGWSWKRLEAELRGCALLCKNCHAGIHAGRLTLLAEDRRHGGQRLALQAIAPQPGVPHTHDECLDTCDSAPRSEVAPRITEPRCSMCGETDPACFYRNKTTVCARCGKAYNLKRDRATAKRAREYLGGKCIACGYAEHDVALDIHHIDPAQKDPAYNRMRSWSWKRVEKELQGCVLLCKNCHAAVHAGQLSLEGLDGYKTIQEPQSG